MLFNSDMNAMKYGKLTCCAPPRPPPAALKIDLKKLFLQACVENVDLKLIYC